MKTTLSTQPKSCWGNQWLTFAVELERSVIEQAPLVIECLDDVRACAKRLLTQHMLQHLPRCILESAALAPYLERWCLDAAALRLRLRLARAAPILLWIKEEQVSFFGGGFASLAAPPYPQPQQPQQPRASQHRHHHHLTCLN